jgi:hypothetical protein
MNNPNWLEKTIPIDSISFDIGFRVESSFYYGPEFNITQDQWESCREAIPTTGLIIRDGFSLSENVINDIDGLILYYDDVIRKTKKHSKDIKYQSSYFRIRPVILTESGQSVSFPIHDHYNESIRLLDALEAGSEGVLYWDQDQCWELEIIAHLGRVYIRDSDPDSSTENLLVNFPADQLVKQISPTRNRLDQIMRRLRARFEIDYWSHDTFKTY